MHKQQEMSSPSLHAFPSLLKSPVFFSLHIQHNLERSSSAQVVYYSLRQGKHLHWFIDQFALSMLQLAIIISIRVPSPTSFASFTGCSSSDSAHRSDSFTSISYMVAVLLRVSSLLFWWFSRARLFAALRLSYVAAVDVVSLVYGRRPYRKRRRRQADRQSGRQSVALHLPFDMVSSSTANFSQCRRRHPNELW